MSNNGYDHDVLKVKNIKEEHFVDGVHLNRRGFDVLMDQLAAFSEPTHSSKEIISVAAVHTSHHATRITSHINISFYNHFDRNLGYIYITNNNKKHDIDDNRTFVLTFQQAQIDSALHQYGAWYAR